MSRAMKDSGVPWLKEIPVDWQVERGKNVLALQKRPVRDNDEVVTCFRDGEVILRSLRRTEGFTMSDKEIGYQGINEGDIVIHGMDGFAGAMGVSKSTGKGSPVLIVCTPKYDAIPRYIIYYLRALAMTDVFVALATGIRERSCDLRWNKVSELEFIMPSSSEQQAIVEFLDRKCAEVDEMIALQEQIIEELKAYKQSVITEAVTKGLNPAAPMRDSGIEWIGQIPEHWSTKRLKNIFRLKTGTTPDGFDIVNEDSEIIPWFTPSDISDDCCELHQSERKLYKSEVGKIELFPKGSLMFVGIGASAGKLGYSHISGYSNQQITALIPDNCNGKYYYYFLIADRKRLRDNAFFTTLPIINNGYLSQNKVVYPPTTEQQAIADYLDEKCADIDSLIQTKQSKIDSLKEYKKSIIYEYVTGKREVE